MRGEKFLSALIVSVMVIGVLTACGPTPTPEVVEKVVKETVVVEKEVEVTKEVEKVVKETVEVEKVVTATPEPELLEEKVLIIGNPTDAVILDPQMSTKWFDYQIYDNIYERLVFLDKDLNIVPALATSWELIDDLTWEFKLREGVNFTNGDPFNANTVKCTIEKIQDPDEGTLMTPYFSGISEVEVVDDYTVRLHTGEVDPLMLARLAGYGGTMIPCGYLEEVGRDEFSIKPVGTGPYKLESWVKDVEMVLVPNEEWWGERPAIDKVIIKPFPEAAARVAALLTGEVDLIQMVPPDMMGVIDESGVATVSLHPGNVNALWGMCYDDCETPILRDTNFRLGMNLAIDRESIVNDLYRGVAMVPNGFILKGDFGYDPSLPPMEYNPEKAKELIEESGYQGETIVMYTTVSDYVPNDKALAETVAAMLGEVGINVDLRIFDTAERGDMIRNKRCPGLFIGNPSSAMFDPASHFWRQLRPGGYYDHGWSVTNKVFFDSMTASESEIDPDKRAELYRKANQALLEDPPWVMVLQQVHTYGVGPKVANWQPRSDHRIQFVDLGVVE